MKALKIAKNEYIKWLVHPRMIVLSCILILLYIMVLQPLKECAVKLGEPVNLLEGYIGICNSPLFLVFLPIVFLILMSDFPPMDYNMIFLLYRCGRKNWILGQFIFLMLADATVLAIVFGGLFVPLITDGYWYNGWSNVITEAVTYFPEEAGHFIKNLIPPNLYFQLTPFEAAAKSTVLLFAYFYLLGMIMMAGKIFGNRMIGLILSAFIIIFGASMAYFDVSAMWFLPAAHAIAAKHYTNFFRQMNCRMWISYGYFLFIIIGLWSSVSLRGSHLNFNNFTEIE